MPIFIRIVQDTKAAVMGRRDKYVNGEKLNVQFPFAVIQKISDTQGVLQLVQKNNDRLTATVNAAVGNYTFFVQVKQNDFTWWEPISIKVKDAVEIMDTSVQSANSLRFELVNNTSSLVKGNLVVNNGGNAFVPPLELKPGIVYKQTNIGQADLAPGTNTVTFITDSFAVRKDIVNWNIHRSMKSAETLDISKLFNDKVANIFKNRYLSPRPKGSTLQLPVQGIGD